MRTMVKKSINTILFAILITGALFAGTDGTLRGKIKDVSTGEPVPGAQIYIADLQIGAITDMEGSYMILNIPIGTYDITISMMGYKKHIEQGVSIIMDKTQWLDVQLEVSKIGMDEVVVRGAQDKLVDTGETHKTTTVSSKDIESLPIRDISELYTLQAGVVKVESRTQGIPDHEERGLEEVHVRGGRSGEIAYMIDGLYIRNPIFGGIGNGTRLNLFAIKEFDWQPGGFNAEYGDAMSAVSNWHTASGEEEYQYRFKYETSLVGAAMGNEYDELRGYNDYNIGFGGPVPFMERLKFWVSGQYTNNDHYRVYEFDDLVYVNHDEDVFPFLLDTETNFMNKDNLVQPWDDEAGFRGFGFDKTLDYFAKLSYKHTPKLRFNASYWNVAAHRKVFNPRYLYWDDGQNELFRDTERFTVEVDHTLEKKVFGKFSVFYTFRLSRFVQEQFQGVRWQDSDSDGYPDWFEWRYSAGDPDKNYRTLSDPYNPNMVPYTVSPDGESIWYHQKDDVSGWYYGQTPGAYNWDAAEQFLDANGNGLWDDGEYWIDNQGQWDQGEPFVDDNDNNAWDPGEYWIDQNGNGWDGPVLKEKAIYRDGSYWLMPDMYVDYNDHLDYRYVEHMYEVDPWWFANAGYNPNFSGLPQDQLYFMPTGDDYYWNEGKAFGGSDRFYGESTAITDEARFDLTSQLTDKWKVRTGVDWKIHKLNFYEIINPWGELGPDSDDKTIQDFSEAFEDTGPDGLLPGDDLYLGPDEGENNGRWDDGEYYDDDNGNGEYDDFREPEEFSYYIQNTFEVPWMVVNAGVRVDGVKYNTKVWADPSGDYSPTRPYYYNDVGIDGIPGNEDEGEGNLAWDEGEPVSTLPEFSGASQQVLFMDADWFWKVSPRLGISHVITDKASFTFNYGVYYQTPIFQNVYLNTSLQADPVEFFEGGEGAIGNATMSASRTQSYEFAFNVQVGQFWAYTIGAWVKNMDQLVTSKVQKSGQYTYRVFSNGDYGSAKGIDITLENRGLVSTMLQYTYSVAKANSEYDWASLGWEAMNAASQEFLMPYDRTHDLTFSLYTIMPFGIVGGITGFYQSGAPYTPVIEESSGNFKSDEENKYSKRAPDYRNINLSFSKYIRIDDYKVTLGMNVFNMMDERNPIDIYPVTGTADDPGEYYTENIGLPTEVPEQLQAKSGSYYDQPWFYSSPRQINFFVRVDFN